MSHWYQPLTRREWLIRGANGFGAVALAAMLAEDHGVAAESRLARPPQRTLHHPAKARSIIFLYMDGGPSQIDTFDYKPALAKFDGQDPRQAMGKLEPTQFANIGKVMKSPWRFQKYGESGAWVSDLFPHIAQHVDDLAIVRSVVSNFPEHTSANYFLHTGSGIQGRPSWGAWCGYGLGSGNRDLPSFVVLNGGLIPPGGLDNFNSGFLPAAFQGSVFRPGNPPVANIAPLEKSSARQQAKLALMRKLDQLANTAHGNDAAIAAAIQNYETAFRMQTAIPELMNLSHESKTTQALYGLQSRYPHTVTFGSQCLIARRLVERGCRFVELTCPNVGHDRWDQHGNLKKGHEDNARAVDQPIAGLITDLKQRGLLDSTLIVWAGEFGRTPFAQGANGRDHNPYGFTVWLAGGGIRGGIQHGETDEWGYKVTQGRVEIHDLHATMLHLLGIDHTRLTFRFGGRDMRLTDVHGELIEPILS
ncbi:MAG: DUF1501 domain-containing protein [Bacteroidales bacterium]|nr:DUF1501 domain-containing protein [Bacteroidales bacterium]